MKIKKQEAQKAMKRKLNSEYYESCSEANQLENK